MKGFPYDDSFVGQEEEDTVRKILHMPVNTRALVALDANRGNVEEYEAKIRKALGKDVGKYELTTIGQPKSRRRSNLSRLIITRRVS